MTLEDGMWKINLTKILSQDVKKGEESARKIVLTAHVR
jgi:hypothetical protein